MTCLKVNAKVLSHPLTIRASLVCGVGKSLLALMVDEGYLFVNGKNGEILYLYVKKANGGRLSSK